MRRQAPRNLHCAIESLAADRFVHQPLPFGFTRIQWLTPADGHGKGGVGGESVQGFGERVAHLRVEVDAFCATKCNHRNSIGCSCRQNIGVHRPSFFINVTSKRTFSTKKTTCSSSLLQPSQKAFPGPSRPQTLPVYPPPPLPFPFSRSAPFGKSFLLD